MNPPAVAALVVVVLISGIAPLALALAAGRRMRLPLRIGE